MPNAVLLRNSFLSLNIQLKNSVKFGQIKEVTLKSNAEHLVNFKFMEEYKGEKIRPGYRGLTFTLTYQSRYRTLTEEEVDTTNENIRQNLMKQLEAIPR